jgi:hypothetical protein
MARIPRKPQSLTLQPQTDIKATCNGAALPAGAKKNAIAISLTVTQRYKVFITLA